MVTPPVRNTQALERKEYASPYRLD